MKKEKIWNRATVVLIVLALVFTSVLAYCPNILKSNQVSTLYASSVFDKTQVMNVNIIMDDKDWDDMLENAANEEYYSCDIEINGTKYYNVGIRPKGNTSLSSIVADDTTDRFSFKVEFDHFQEGQTMDGLDKLCLNNIMADATYMKEYITYDILSYLGVNSSLYSYASVNRNGKCWGLYLAFESIEESFLERTYGDATGNLYKPENMGMGGKDGGMDDMKKFENMTEEEKEAMKQKFQGGNAGQQSAPDKQAVEDQQPAPDQQAGQDQQAADQQNAKTQQDTQAAPNNNASPPDGMDHNGPGGGMGSDLAYIDDDSNSYDVIWESSILDDASDADKKRVITALKNISSKENVEDYLDVDQMLRYIAANVVVLNDDSYFGNMLHNYYIYENEGVLSMLPWDYNLAFGGFAMGANSDATNLINRAIDDVISSGSLEDRPFIAAALSTEEYQQQYHDYLQNLIDGYFTSGTFETTIQKLKKMISSYVKNDPTAFYTYDEFETGVDTLEKFVNARVESIQKQLDGEIPATAADRSGDGYTLVDGSDINVKDMGTQGGGDKGPGGDGGFDFNQGNTDENTQDGQNKDVNSDANVNANTNSDSNAQPQTTEQNEDDIAGQSATTQSSTDKSQNKEQIQEPQGQAEGKPEGMPEGFTPPGGQSGEMPEGFTPPDGQSGGMPEGFTPPDGQSGEMPEGFTPPDGQSGEMPEGFTPPDGQTGEKPEATQPAQEQIDENQQEVQPTKEQQDTSKDQGQEQDSKDQQGAQMPNMDGADGGFPQGGPPGMDSGASKTSEIEGLVVTGVSVAVLFGAFVFVKLFKRRKYRAK